MMDSVSSNKCLMAAAVYFTVATAGNLISDKLDFQFCKNHCDFHAYWVLNKLKISNLLSLFGPIFSETLIISGKQQISEELT